MQYDATGRLTSRYTAQKTRTYTYGAEGNILTENGV